MRSVCVEMLGRLGPEAASALPTLQRELAPSTPHERCLVLRALASIAPEDPEVLKAVKEALSDPYSWIRQAAAKALEKIESPSPGEGAGKE